MTQDTYKKVIDLLPLAGDCFSISCAFEPTIHPNYIDFLEEVPEKYKKKIFFTTNLTTTITDEQLQRLSRTAISHINISIDSLQKTIFEQLRKGASFDKFIDNLNRLVFIFQKNPTAPDIHYITMALKQNINEIPHIVEKCAKEYSGAKHEARYVFPHFKPDSPYSTIHRDEWKRQHLIFANDWERLEKYADECSSNFHVSRPPQDHYEHRQARKVCNLWLYVNSEGIVTVHYKKDVKYNINRIRKPYIFFKNILQKINVNQKIDRLAMRLSRLISK